MLRVKGVEILKIYKEAAEDEEKLLGHKAKVTWLKEGDKNSAYFHKVLKGRLNKSRIMTVYVNNGIRYNNCDVAEQFVKRFTGFLGISPTVSKLKEEYNGLFKRRISQEEGNLMSYEINDEEIKKSLFDIDDNKAPGLDGFTSIFYKNAWDTIKSDFYVAIKELFI
nr:RNA-directed DNA polymerase, eukaryota, reverse transcriptase zinc-binding domain protein [Tanacetum cinerariifolium]